MLVVEHFSLGHWYVLIWPLIKNVKPLRKFSTLVLNVEPILPSPGFGFLNDFFGAMVSRTSADVWKELENRHSSKTAYILAVRLLLPCFVKKFAAPFFQHTEHAGALDRHCSKHFTAKERLEPSRPTKKWPWILERVVAVLAAICVARVGTWRHSSKARHITCLHITVSEG